MQLCACQEDLQDMLKTASLRKDTKTEQKTSKNIKKLTNKVNGGPDKGYSLGSICFGSPSYRWSHDHHWYAMVSPCQSALRLRERYCAPICSNMFQSNFVRMLVLQLRHQLLQTGMEMPLLLPTRLSRALLGTSIVLDLDVLTHLQ